jgi:hypothetical protein
MSEEQRKKDLWFNFDNYYEWQAPDSRGSTIAKLDNWSDTTFGRLTTKDLEEFLNTQNGKEIVDYVRELAPFYIQTFDNYFGPDFDQNTNIKDSFPWQAFIEFGLGMLYDPRPPRVPTYYIHVMDVGRIGYNRWHRLNWVASKIYPIIPFSSGPGKWLFLDRLVGLASELHSRSKPRQSSRNGSEPKNPPNGDNLSMNEIHAISNEWLNLDFEDIEKKLPTMENWIPPNAA